MIGKKLPLVSVVVTCYNYGRYLEEAVESVLNQTYKNIEIVIINDGSTDNTKGIAEKLEATNDNVRYIEQENKGVVYTRNRAIKEASGKYYIQLDADDYLDLDYIEKTVKMAEAESADLVYTDFKIFDGKSIETSNFPEYNFEYLKNRNFIHISALVKKSSTEGFWFDEEFSDKSHEDWDFFLRVCASGILPVKCTGTYLNYRRHGAGRNNMQKSENDKLDYAEFYQYMISKCQKQNHDEFHYLFGPRIAKWYIDKHKENSNLKKILESQKSRSEELVQEINVLRDRLERIQLSKEYRLGLGILKLPRSALHNVRSIGILNGWKMDERGVLNEYYNLESSGKLPVVTLVLKNAASPTSSAFIRLISPILATGKYQIKLVDGEDVGSIDKKTEICIVQRVALRDLAAAKKLVELLYEKNIPLITDTDDAFCHIEKSHPEYEDIRIRSDALTYLMAKADINTYSTKRLRDMYDKITGRKDGEVVVNTLDESLWSRLRGRLVDTSRSEALQVLYMGTPTHHEDFNMVYDALQQVYDRNPGSFQLTVVGISRDITVKPWLRVVPPDQIIYPGFVEWLSHQGPFDIGISPLLDTEFNKNKSDIKALDYIGIGAKPIVSDVLAYQTKELDKLVVRVKNTPKDWRKEIENAIENKSKLRRDKNQKKVGYEYLSTERSAEVSGRIYVQLIKRVIRMRSE